MSDNLIGLIAAFSANAISAGIGALIGARLCDLFGRKRISQYDMLFYAFGMLFLMLGVAPQKAISKSCWALAWRCLLNCRAWD